MEKMKRIFACLAAFALTGLAAFAATTALTLKVGETKTVDVSASALFGVQWSSTVTGDSDCVSVKFADTSSKKTTATASVSVGGTTTSANTTYTVTVTAKTPGTASVEVYTGTRTTSKGKTTTTWSSTPLKTLEFEVVPPEPPDPDLLTGELRISEICPDDELLDPHGVNSGFIELLNCSDHAVNLKDWSLGRFNRG